MNDPTLNTDTENRSPQILEEDEVLEDESFLYDGYQVVRGEFFAHIFEPSVTLNREKVSVNVACLRKLPGTEYVQFLVNPTEKKLAVKPSSEEIKDSFRWCSGEGKNRKPKTITCRIFFGKVMSLMNWNPEYRYKILGKLIRTKSDLLFVFDLNCAETYRCREGGKESHSRSPLYPDSWKNQFGVPANEHQDMLQISIFDDHAVFRISRAEEDSRKDISNNGNSFDSSINPGSEKTPDTNPQADTPATE